MKIPFPDIASGLAVQSHMYICMQNDTKKAFAKCQTFKPHHLLSNRRPFQCVVEEADLNRNPFNHKTVVDCDKFFEMERLVVDQSLLTHTRRDVCQALYHSIQQTSAHQLLARHVLDGQVLVSLNNNQIRPVS